MKVVTVLGTRPQFIKAALISKELKNRHILEIIVHTGQHYDANMSKKFFDDLDLPEPKYHLDVGNQTSNKMVSEMMDKLEKVFNDEKPEAIIVYGDCDTTLAGALTGNKMKLTVIHIEAGVRSGDLSMPEEINRLLVDRLATIRLCPTKSSIENLEKENIIRNNHLVGDPMIALLERIKPLVSLDVLSQKKYYLLTLHRASNITKEVLPKILNELNDLDLPVIWPVHPRAQALLEILDNGNSLPPPYNFEIIPPVGYIEMIKLILGAEKVITDSGGLQKEAYACQKPCITLRSTTEWNELVKTGWNLLIDPIVETCYTKCIINFSPDSASYQPMFTEQSVDLIVDQISKSSQHSHPQQLV